MNMSPEAWGGAFSVFLAVLGALWKYMKSQAKISTKIDDFESKSTKDIDELRTTAMFLSGELIKVQSKTIGLSDENKTLTKQVNDLTYTVLKYEAEKKQSDLDKDTLAMKNGELAALVEKQDGIIQASNKTIAEYEQRLKTQEQDHAATLHRIELEKIELEGRVQGALTVVSMLKIQLPQNETKSIPDPETGI